MTGGNSLPPKLEKDEMRGRERDGLAIITGISLWRSYWDHAVVRLLEETNVEGYRWRARVQPRRRHVSGDETFAGRGVDTKQSRWFARLASRSPNLDLVWKKSASRRPRWKFVIPTSFDTRQTWLCARNLNDEICICKTKRRATLYYFLIWDASSDVPVAYSFSTNSFSFVFSSIPRRFSNDLASNVARRHFSTAVTVA